MLHLLLALSLAAGPLCTLQGPAVDEWLGELHDSTPDFHARLRAVADAALDTPYDGGPLGEGPEGKYDSDPLIDLTRADCVTFIEQAVALAGADDLAEATEELQRIRYKDACIDYESRNHFMVTDWLRNNPWCEPIADELGVPTGEVTRTISRKGFFERVEAPGLAANVPDEDVTLAYVPMAHAGAAEAELPDAAVILFIGKIDWLFTLHTGLYLRDKSGTSRLYHASTQAEKVISQPLGEYLAGQQERYLGFVPCRIDPPPFADAAPEETPQS